MAITQKLKSLSQEMEMHNQEKKQVASTTLKQPIGRPQKQLHAPLIVEKEVKQKDNKEDENSKSTKRGKT